MNEEVPANNAGSGNIDGIGVGLRGEPGVNKTKYKKDNIKMTKRILKRFRDFEVRK